MSLWVAGLDGCRSGWVCARFDLTGAADPLVSIAASLAEVVADPELAFIALDIPIGLPERAGPGGRACDRDLRARLGARRSSVFSTPVRAAVTATDYAAACAANHAASDPPRRISRQSFNIMPKIREADAVVRPDLQDRVFECHPEGAFWAMNGGAPLGEPKKLRSRPYPPGMALRRRLLEDAGFPIGRLAAGAIRRAEAGEDDILDACACAVTAARRARGEAMRLPEGEAPRDARGLRMEIWV